ncbi:transcriptional regulator [Paenibacillus beijingensis]|uniref:Transcriptional regulator n=2 Tax=Paenibacillus beijingensis TaxID=1126833 RepID=A0A0D5NQ64_9BACL|nr:ArsR family transcriptional regulator [Paenibacillus beijingensis]AJY77401.1 transcriptional regulator [Paenibacillus beijingensis]
MSREEGATRRAILNLLKIGGTKSAADLSQQLGLTEMAVRRHLYALERDGHVRMQPLRQGTGRPVHRYGLTEQSGELFPKNYAALALDLLGEAAAKDEAAIELMFKGREHKLLGRYKPRMDGRPLRERVAELAEIQNAAGYMAVLEEKAAGSYELHEYNCPISQVADTYQQACNCELSLFESLLEADVERRECLAKGGTRCTYTIKAKALECDR